MKEETTISLTLHRICSDAINLILVSTNSIDDKLEALHDIVHQASLSLDMLHDKLDLKCSNNGTSDVLQKYHSFTTGTYTKS